jgi:hypothetical protein
MARAPEECSQSRRQLFHSEGLYEVVVGAGVETGDASVDRVACRKYQDWERRVASSQFSEHIETITVGQTKI